MKTTFRNRIVLGLALVLASALSAGPALAGGHGGGGHGGGGHGGHGGWHGGSHYAIGLNFGFGGYYGGYYGYPYYPYYSYPYYPAYYPSPVVVQQQPTTYVEQPQVQDQPSGYWYFCPASKAYYPYVKDCAAGWQRVAPQPGN